MTVRPARTADAALVADIYNHGIADRTATFETEPRTAAQMEKRIEDGVRRHSLLVGDAEGRVDGGLCLSFARLLRRRRRVLRVRRSRLA